MAPSKRTTTTTTASHASSLTYKSTISVQQQQQGQPPPPHHPSASTTLKFDDGAIQFRQRICVAILTHRRLLIRNIRNSDNNNNTNNSMIIGLQSHEASFLKLIDRLTNGSTIEINATGTQLSFQPGLLLGGTIHHDCPVGMNNSMDNTTETSALTDVATERELQQLTVRNIGWYLEGILPLAPFGKEPLHLTLTGITDNNMTMNGDPSCDYIRYAVLPVLSKFGIGEPLVSTHPSNAATTDLLDNDIGRPSIKVLRRGGAPLGGGSVTFTCPMVRHTLQPARLLQDWTDMGKVKRIRGQVITCQLVSSSMAARIAYSAKGVCHKLLPDVWIHTDVHTQKNHQCGPSPSVNLILTAETTTGVVYTHEVALRTAGVSSSSFPSSSSNHHHEADRGRELPEELGVRGAVGLLQEIQRGGCMDTNLQSFVLLLLCLCPEQEVSRIRVGPLSPNTIVSLRLFQQALGVTFQIKPDVATKTVIISGIGIGYTNMARAST